MTARFPLDTVRGDGVTLRPPVEGDADDIAAACGDEAISTFLARLPQPYTRADALDFITGHAPRSWAIGAPTFVVADPATDRVLGAVALSEVRLAGATAAIGYWTAPWARRRGVATAAARTLADWAFRHRTQRLELMTRITNEASQRVALGAGFQHEALRRAYGDGDGNRLADRAVWVRLDTDPDAPAPRIFPDLPGGSLTDGVVTLRRLGIEDVDAKFALDLLPEVRAGSVRADPTYEETRDRCESAAYDWLAGNRATFAILDAQTGAYAGDLGVFHPDPIGQAMIGYSVGREWRGRGYAPRAARLVVDWAFAHAGFARIIAGTAADNVASQRVLEKAGFAREGYEKGRLPGRDGGPRIDNIAFGISAEGRGTPPPR